MTDKHAPEDGVDSPKRDATIRAKRNNNSFFLLIVALLTPFKHEHRVGLETLSELKRNQIYNAWNSDNTGCYSRHAEERQGLRSGRKEALGEPCQS